MTEQQHDYGPAPDHIASRAVPPAEIDAVTSDLEARAFLHDDPSAYRAGVRDALSELVIRSHAPRERSGTG